EGAAWVNGRGRLYTEELGSPTLDTAKQPERMAWILFDPAIAGAFPAWPNYVSTAPGVAYAYLADYRRNRADIYHQSATLEGLARSMGAPSETLPRAASEHTTPPRPAPPAP